jgi:hypothetical protein
MTNSAALEELDLFNDSFRRIYRYKQEFIPDHYVAILKEGDEFVVNVVDSTTDIEGFNKEMFIKLLVKEELIFQTSNVYVDTTELRTDSCECGAWASTPNNHVYWCKKYV